MSTVRMCDRCGTIFSERADDWSTFTGTTVRKNSETGRRETVTDTLDACPECSELMMGPAQRPELPTSVSPRYEKGTNGD